MRGAVPKNHLVRVLSPSEGTERETLFSTTSGCSSAHFVTPTAAARTKRSGSQPAVPIVTPVTPTRAERNTSPHTLVVLETGDYVAFPAVVGRSRKCDVVVDEPTVCRAHLRVAVDENGAPSVRCVGRKGAAEAACDGEVIAPGAAVPLRQGACISLGGAKFRHMQRPVTIFERFRLGKR